MIGLQEKVQEGERRLKVVRVERREEVRDSRDYRSSTVESERVVRSQMPVAVSVPHQLSGRQQGQGGQGQDRVRVRLLEQEVN